MYVISCLPPAAAARVPRDPLVQQATKGDHLPDLTGEDDDEEEGEEETRGPSPSKEPHLSRSEAQKKVGGRGEESCVCGASANPAKQMTNKR